MISIVIVIVAVEVLVMGSAFFRAALAKARTGKTTIDNADRGETQPPKKL